MEQALQKIGGVEILVSASDVQSEFRGRVPDGLSFLCPFCRQPLNPTAMGFGGKQSPHFRHERNNKRARECELYAANYGYSSVCRHAPLPMFIRPARSDQSFFVIEGGFGFPGKDRIMKMESARALLRTGQKEYRVTSKRFGPGLTRLPFDEVALNFSSIVRLCNSPIGMDDIWGYPEDARRAAVFTRDSDSGQGRRIKTGDSIPTCSALYLLAPDREEEPIRYAFSGARKVGYTGPRSSKMRLAVFEINAPDNVSSVDPGVAYLGDCGFQVSDFDETPKLVWPPSLTSSGAITPLFKESKCIFTLARLGSSEKKLYVHFTDSALDPTSIPLSQSSNEEACFGFLRSDGDLCFVSTDELAYSSAVLLRPCDALLDKIPAPSSPFLADGEKADKISHLVLCQPGCIQLLSKGREPRTTKVKSDNQSVVELESGSFDVVRIMQDLHASSDMLVVFEFSSRGTVVDKLPKSSMRSPRELLLAHSLPDDVNRAVYRKDASIAGRMKCQRDKRIAVIRRDAR